MPASSNLHPLSPPQHGSFKRRDYSIRLEPFALSNPLANEEKEGGREGRANGREGGREEGRRDKNKKEEKKLMDAFG